MTRRTRSACVPGPGGLPTRGEIWKPYTVVDRRGWWQCLPTRAYRPTCGGLPKTSVKPWPLRPCWGSDSPRRLSLPLRAVPPDARRDTPRVEYDSLSNVVAGFDETSVSAGVEVVVDGDLSPVCRPVPISGLLWFNFDWYGEQNCQERDFQTRATPIPDESCSTSAYGRCADTTVDAIPGRRPGGHPAS